ncbi:hypothetical protein NADFUDRAFT_70338 [Nadsonia fulvescens var. elongata DSM 6958]|uniref:Uncharacterized protein n=1 Tax=Nadsonia fulvescens var. elongata DSM 6958 TaxID=857566 RepID=A0A1E3PKR6_9ASCO|nr:hypothetical protein NADFUDRAFT_70338 [Nadsonia fulvescens var. elongata DSM 6958]
MWLGLRGALPLVPDPVIADASLHNSLPTLAKAYVWPFLALYPSFFYVYLFKYDKYITGREWTTVFLGIIITFQSLLWLMTNWNVNIRAKFTTTVAANVETAELIKLHPVANSGSANICAINHIKSEDHEEISFIFQKRRFIYDVESKTFNPPKFAIDEEPCIGDIQHAAGLNTENIPLLNRKYGANTFDIPVPTFTELFKEHAVAPFFVFQIFCVGLWCLDDYWYYSIFTLFMLVVFESTVVWQRQRTLTEFRGMGIKPYSIYVYRGSKWVEIQTDELLPGDVVSIERSSEESGLPCDLVLINGTAIVNEAMLSGESTPLLKESIALRPADALLSVDGLDKNSLLYGGTKVLQVTEPIHSHIPLSPNKGALAVVSKTGFETSQGSLVRVMIFSTEHVGVGNKEALFFILFLCIFAIAASWYVWAEGVKADRKRSKLLLDCVLIITSVVPPELPMELTLAVNTSLAALSKYFIFCTEPFRIPFAGRVDICCFDKTGTLTGEDLVVEGVAGLGSGLSEITNVPKTTTLVLGAAHALVLLDEGDIVGDPMEKTTLKSINWTVGSNDTVYSIDNPDFKLNILRRFQFSSALKRSSAIANVAGKVLVAVKGAPETIKGMLTTVPKEYEETYKHYTRNGSRVLALGYKHLEDNICESKVTDMKRESVESELTFAGFLVFHCPLKDDAIESVKMLNESSHRVVMITGDNPLTAVHVAKAVEIVERENVLILDAPEDGQGDSELVWRTVDESVVIPVSSSDPLDKSIFNNYDLCVTGYALAKLSDHEHIVELLEHTWVYARVSPAQKEFILVTLKEAGYTTLMCGDGTNDVGALKQAHVGVALLNGTDEGMKKLADNARCTSLQKMYEKQVDIMKKWGNGKVPPVPIGIAHLYPPGPNNPHYIKALENRGGVVDEKTLAEIQDLYNNQIEDSSNVQPPVAADNAAAFADRMMGMLEEQEDDAPTLKLGDASIAAPFTSKLANVSAITHIIRQGRCTLVATIQMYKILALNCLISAYSLSALYLAGIKIGDGQATISGVLLSVCFMSISRAKPVEKLSKERPQPGIFNWYIMGSILGQFAIHIITLLYIQGSVYALEPREQMVDLEGEFKPSLLNTAVYLLQLAQQISTFTVNYQGRPFRESIKENKAMYYGLIAVSAFAFSAATEFVPEINEQLQLVPMDYVFKTKLTFSMALDVGACYAIETVFKHLFADNKPKPITFRLSDRRKNLRKTKNTKKKKKN